MEKPKTFLLMMPDYSDFPNLFLSNLEKEGYIPYLITDNPSEFKYKGKEKIINFFKKTFFNNREYKKKLIEDHKLKEYFKKIEEIEEQLDYALVIRPDLFPIEIIKKLKTKVKKLVAYQWDGIEKFPTIKNYFSLFDSFFCFDYKDDKNNIKQITNFYFDCIKPTYRQFNLQKPQLYFVGLYWQNREDKIDKFINQISEYNVDLSIFIQYNNIKEIKNPKIKYIKNRITFLENLKNVEKADILLDFVDPVHNGLSIRFFEAMYYKKKIITDNKMVKKYDFYNPNNILIIDNNFEEIDRFIKTPYLEIPENTLAKYSFKNWIKEITK